MKKLIMLLTICTIYNDIIAQTNVSGLISVNTTWTTAGNPYLVVGNVDVDLGITLTIAPGVIVKFDGLYYIYVDGTLKAIGTSSDSIYFTSNSTTPQEGDWVGIKFRPSSIANLNNIQYCRFEYAEKAIAIDGSSPTIHNSLIQYNQIGIYMEWNAGNPIIRDNILRYNSTSGISGSTNSGYDVIGNQILFNGNGIDILSFANKIDSNIITNNNNGIYLDAGGGFLISEIIGNTVSGNLVDGMYLSAFPLSITLFENNIISNNNGNGIYCFNVQATFLNNEIAENGVGIWNANGSYPPNLFFHQNCIVANGFNFKQYEDSNIDGNNNWWGSADSLIIGGTIYDFYDNFSLGKVLFSPFLVTSTGSCSIINTVQEPENISDESLVSVYPNPFSTSISITIQKQNIKQTEFTIKNILGQTVFSKQENNQNASCLKTIDLSFLSNGIYLLEVNIDAERTYKKIVKP